MWFDSLDEDEEAGCVSNLSDEVCLNALERNTTYTLCLLEETKDVEIDGKIYAPRHCRGITTSPSWEDRSWITNKFILTTIAIIISSLIIAIIIAGLLTYLCIRQHPKLIEGSKKVIVIKENDKRQINETEVEFDRPPYIDPSFIYERGYLTPNFHKYSRIKYRPNCSGNQSHWTVYNDNEAYVQANSPSRQQLETWRTNGQRKRPRLDNIYSYNQGSDYAEIPPPIPGGHPFNRQKRNNPYPYLHDIYSIV